MKIIFAVVFVIAYSIVVYATPLTRLPHPVFALSESYAIAVEIQSVQREYLPTETAKHLFLTAFKITLESFSRHHDLAPVIITSENLQQYPETQISISVRGIETARSSCVMAIDYTIKNELYSVSDFCIYSTSYDPQTITGTYRDKKLAMIDGAIRNFITDLCKEYFRYPEPEQQ